MAKVIVKCNQCGKKFRIQKKWKHSSNGRCIKCFDKYLDFKSCIKYLEDPSFW